MLQANQNGTGVVSELDATATEGRTAVLIRSEVPPRPIQEDQQERPETRPALAVFCYEDPESVVGRFVTRLASALTRRDIAVHVFSRRDFALDALGVASHALGGDEGDDLVSPVQEFAGRACNAFLKLFPGGCGNVTLMGLEWSAIPVLALLQGLKNLNVILSLHSLERQRSDLTSDVSQQIEAIEQAGLRAAKAILVHDPVTAAVAQAAVPECAERLTPVRDIFPAHLFETPLDPGEVKARYQIGPIDPTIVFLGDLSERYGPDLLVKAMPGILKNHPQARLVVAGAGDLYWPLRVYSRYLLLEHAVRLPGSVEGQAACELLQAADVVVVPSRESTSWWPIQAAWAARRPVVATHPLAPGLLEHEGDAVLCYPSENSLVWGVERVLFDAELRQRLGEKGSLKLNDQFGWGQVAAQVEALMSAAVMR